MTTTFEPAFSVGKYLVSPFTHLTDGGHYAASVSIRSGRGSGTHDRVFRFTARFGTRESARRYAVEQGMQWVHQPSDGVQPDLPLDPQGVSFGQGRID